MLRKIGLAKWSKHLNCIDGHLYNVHCTQCTVHLCVASLILQISQVFYVRIVCLVIYINWENRSVAKRLRPNTKRPTTCRDRTTYVQRYSWKNKCLEHLRTHMQQSYSSDHYSQYMPLDWRKVSRAKIGDRIQLMCAMCNVYTLPHIYLHTWETDWLSLETVDRSIA